MNIRPIRHYAPTCPACGAEHENLSCDEGAELTCKCGARFLVRIHVPEVRLEYECTLIDGTGVPDEQRISGRFGRNDPSLLELLETTPPSVNLTYPHTRIVCRCGATMSAEPAREGKAIVRCPKCGLVGEVRASDFPNGIPEQMLVPHVVEVACSTCGKPAVCFATYRGEGGQVYSCPAENDTPEIVEGVRIECLRLDRSINHMTVKPGAAAEVSWGHLCPNCSEPTIADGALCHECDREPTKD